MHDDLLPCARLAAVLAEVRAPREVPVTLDWALEAGARPPRRVEREVARLARTAQGIVDGFVLLRACAPRAASSAPPGAPAGAADVARPPAARGSNDPAPAHVGDELLAGLRRVRAGGTYVELTWLAPGGVRGSALGRLVSRLRWRRRDASQLDAPASTTAALALRVATLAGLGLSELSVRRPADVPDVAVIQGLVRPAAPLA